MYPEKPIKFIISSREIDIIDNRYIVRKPKNNYYNHTIMMFVLKVVSKTEVTFFYYNYCITRNFNFDLSTNLTRFFNTSNYNFSNTRD